MSTTPLLYGYCPPPQQGGTYPSVHSAPRAYYAETEPWYHPNIPDHHQLVQPSPLSFHWRPPVRARGVGPRPWQGSRSKERGRWSSGSTCLFECKPCNKHYKSKEAYTTHLKSHLKCSSCEFEGAGKAFKDHQLMHMLPDELKFTSEEDIVKWREERKRKYPTAENIEKKKRLAADKNERGESAITPLHRYIQHVIGDNKNFHGRRGSRGKGCGKRGRFSNHQHDSHKQMCPPRQDSTNEKQTLTDDNTSQTQENILGAILADCGSQSTESKHKHNLSSLKEHCLEESRERKWTTCSRRQNKAAAMGLKCVSGQRKPTLLEKLLGPEIRREENALLQCIRHITMNDFFKLS